MTLRIDLVLVVASSLAIAGCGSAPVVRETRDAPTGIGADEEIAVFLATYGHHEGTGKSIKELEVDHAEVERQFEACLRQGMLSARDGLRFVGPQALRQALFPGERVGEL